MRPRFQFRLRTLLIGVTLLAVLLGYVGWQAKIVRERKAILREVTEMRGILILASDVSGQAAVVNLGQKRFKPPYPTISRLRAWLGDDCALSIELPESAPPNTIARVQAAEA